MWFLILTVWRFQVNFDRFFPRGSITIGFLRKKKNFAGAGINDSGTIMINGADKLSSIVIHCNNIYYPFIIGTGFNQVEEWVLFNWSRIFLFNCFIDPARIDIFDFIYIRWKSVTNNPLSRFTVEFMYRLLKLSEQPDI